MNREERLINKRILLLIIIMVLLWGITIFIMS